jgi:hypothetical protein
VLGSAFARPSARLDSSTCSLKTLNGAYASNQAGTLNGLPVALVNRVVSDGNGNITGSGTRVANGIVTVIPSFTATYTINSDCTGTFTTSTGVQQNLVITQNGKEVQFIVTVSPAGPATISGRAISLGGGD